MPVLRVSCRLRRGCWRQFVLHVEADDSKFVWALHPLGHGAASTLFLWLERRSPCPSSLFQVVPCVVSFEALWLSHFRSASKMISIFGGQMLLETELFDNCIRLLHVDSAPSARSSWNHLGPHRIDDQLHSSHTLRRFCMFCKSRGLHRCLRTMFQLWCFLSLNKQPSSLMEWCWRSSEFGISPASSSALRLRQWSQRVLATASSWTTQVQSTVDRPGSSSHFIVAEGEGGGTGSRCGRLLWRKKLFSTDPSASSS